MRLIFITSRLPYPPDRGDRLRVYHFLRSLAVEHEISLVTFITSEEERSSLTHLRSYCADIHVVLWPTWRSTITVAANFWRPLPLQALNYRSAVMKRLIDDLLTAQKFDAAYIHLFRMAPYLPARRDFYRIVDLTDIISREIELSLPYRSRFWRWLYRLELPRIRRFEQQVADQFEETWLISRAGQHALTAVAPQANIRVIPNGVETHSRHKETAVSRQPNLLFVGNMRVFHNIDAAHFLVNEIFPLVCEVIPDCSLRLVGAGVGREVRQLENHPGVSVLGFVPDLADVFGESTVFVAPLRFAAGIQNKVLEAMAAGVPVVTTSIVNAGLAALPDREILISDSAIDLAFHIITLLHDDPLRSQIGRAGRRFVEQRFSWQNVVDRMAQIELGLESRS